MRRASLRLRLFALILVPLVLVALVLGYWRVNAAQNTAKELFDRTLLSAALAISRDVAVSDGDALLPSTCDMIQDASGGEVFYHVTGPGGIYVTGYAYPPVAATVSSTDRYAPHFYGARYRGQAVRVLQVTERVTIDTLTGDGTVTVWQRVTDRQAFANQLATRAAGVMGVLLITLALVVWFGVALGLRPLIDLQQAIVARSPNDLSRIKRPVPIEAHGIVQTLNRLFGQVETSMNAHQVFISDAAHQLRNPAAAVQSMAEAVRDAKTGSDRDRRIAELVAAARNSARVADQLLSLDRLQQPAQDALVGDFNLSQLIEGLCADMGPMILSRGLDFELSAPKETVLCGGDQTTIAAAVKNLINNALTHGGETLSAIKVTLSTDPTGAQITVSDDGKGLGPEHTDAAFRRSSQVEPSEGSGLGLAIAASVAERHDGTLTINRVDAGASLTLSLPCKTRRSSV